MLNVACRITISRIVGTVFLLFTKPLSTVFFILYTLAGITDVLDGFVARKTSTSTEFGKKLDSAADLLFYAVMLFRIFPVMLECLPEGVWYFVALVIFLRLAAYGVAAFKLRRFASKHSYMNKITGFMVFILPYVIRLSVARYISFVICTVACISALQELIGYLRADAEKDKV